MLSKVVLDQLLDPIKKLLEVCQSHGLLADGTVLSFYSSTRLSVRVIDARERKCS